MANDACRTGVIILGPPIPWACKHRVQFTANKRLDELANPFAYTDLDWIKPVVEKVGGGVRCRLDGIRLRGNVCHGVVSVPALQRRMIRGSTRRLRQPNSHHFRYGTAVATAIALMGTANAVPITIYGASQEYTAKVAKWYDEAPQALRSKINPLL